MRIALALAFAAISCTPPAPTGDAKAKTDAKAKADGKKAGDKKADEPAPTTAVDPPAPKDAKTWSFDDAEVGKPAPGFAITQTGEIVTPAATWEVVADDEAPSGDKVFGVTKTVGTNKSFNVALIEGTSYRDLEATVMLKSLTGENNKGGGIIFRAKGDNDYYVARWNPVENNFRLYALLAGARVDITSAPLELDATQWHSLKVTIKGDKIECFVDDKSIVTAIDKAIPDAGMIGLWTKGDAATLFDDLTVSTQD